MEITRLDGKTFRHILCGGANGIRLHIDEINDLNVFPVPDGDTGTNMTKTIESGVVKMMENEALTLSEVAKEFAKGSLFGARGNSGVILSQFFAGVCEELAQKETASAEDLSMAYLQGVKRSYSAVVTPVEGTILTVVRESAEYAKDRIKEDSTIEEFLKLNIEEAERSLARTKEILPVLSEADVVDSGGAGYLYIAKGMYAALCDEDETQLPEVTPKSSAQPNYDLFTTDSVLTFGYCTECMVRLQREKLLRKELDVKSFTEQLEAMDCNSIVAIRDGDLLKVHAHTRTPSDVLTLCQEYGEFLNVKIENMSLQHSEKENTVPDTSKKKKAPHKRYGVVTVATGEGIKALFASLGADVIIDGGQTGNPSAEQFLAAFEELNADAIFVFPNNGNILLTAQQAAELWEGAPVTVIPTKTLPQGYAALAVFNPSVTVPEEQIADLISAKDAVVSGELTVAVRDTVIGGVSVKEGEYIGILDGELLTSHSDPVRALGDMIEKIEDLSDRELITLFVGESVSDRERVTVTEALEERFEDHVIEVYLGGQKIYDYLIAVE
ncbi:MAG: DAK2 domain-containing protein [Clostridia bacterium]|nr:DAK2 domain-containing protein [Clostridia bacterium]